MKNGKSKNDWINYLKVFLNKHPCLLNIKTKEYNLIYL